MNYSKTFFNKNLDDLQIRDIIDFFSEEKTESTTIEFKSFAKVHGIFNEKLNNIKEGICGLLNSEGGVLIWGSPEGTKVEGKKEKIFIGKLSPVTELKEKDSLINTISDSITPLPTGISVKVLEDNKKYIYVFEVQQSNYKPHQFENKYWIRLDGQTRIAPHYLIEALFKQIKYPNIEGYLKFNKITLQHDGNYIINVGVTIWNFSKFQNEEKISFSLTCPQGIFAGYGGVLSTEDFSLEGHQIVHRNSIDILRYGEPNIHYKSIILNPHMLECKYNDEIELILIFGGRYSPSKQSSYKLSFKDFKKNTLINPNELIKECGENILFSKIQEDLGVKKEQQLKEFLGR